MELHWSLIIFTFFICAASGTFVMQGIRCVQRKGKKTQMLSIVVSLILLVIGGIGVFTHLQHWERIFNGFGHITSGITWELIGCVLFGIAIVLYFLFMIRSEDGMAPRWCGVLAIVIPLLLVVIMGDSYLMPSRPVWDTPLLILFYLANTLFMGGFIGIFVAAKTGDRQGAIAVSKYTIIGGIVQVVVLVAYMIYLLVIGNGAYSDVGYYFDPTLPDVHMTDAAAIMASPLDGSNALLFWLGVVVIGLVAPIAIMWRDRKTGVYEQAEPATLDTQNVEDSPESAKAQETDEALMDTTALDADQADVEQDAKSESEVLYAQDQDVANEQDVEFAAEESDENVDDFDEDIDFIDEQAGKEKIDRIKWIKEFLNIQKSVLTKKALTTTAAALACTAVGGVCWRVILYITAISAFPIY